MSAHPSYLALDAHLSREDAAVSAHVAQCDRCRAHLDLVRAPLPMPIALRQAPARRRWWPVAVAAPLALAAAALFVVRAPDDNATTAKGTPTVTLWLHHEGRAVRWQGQPFEKGDSIRFEVAGSGLTHLVVFDEVTRSALFEARLSTPAAMLTPAWQLDGLSAVERLQVVLDAEEAAPAAPLPSCTPTPARWCQSFTLNRSVP